MGIKHLNKFLREECNDVIKFISLSYLSGKKIVIDISIYMYKFASDDTLIENMYLMLSIFHHYNIIPIFIFDGKPPVEKKDILQKRKYDKKEAEEEYNKLKQQLEKDKEIDEIERQEILNNMDMLKKKFICINRCQIESVKNLIRAYGASYYDAPGEADQLCASLVLNNKVWCCLSEDMDLFLYGCPRVIRYFSLLNHTAVLYDIKLILDNLGISQKELREVCVLSGTDYNYNNETKNLNLYKTLKYFKKYKKSKSQLEFYEWLKETTDYIKDYELLKKIYEMFEISNYDFKNFDEIKIINSPIKKELVKEILIQDGFIFPIKSN